MMKSEKSHRHTTLGRPFPLQRRFPAEQLRYTIEATINMVSFSGRAKTYLVLIYLFYAAGGYFKPVEQIEASTGAALFLTLASYLVGCIFIVDVLFNWGWLWGKFQPSVPARVATRLLLFAVLFAAGHGLRNGGSLNLLSSAWRSVYWETVPMAMCALIVVGSGCRELVVSLPRMLLWQSAIGATFIGLVVWNYPIGQSRELFGGPHYTAYALASISILPLAMLEKYTTWERFVILIAYGAFVVLNLIYQSRGGFLITGIAVPLYILCGKIHSRQSLQLKSRDGWSYFGKKTRRAFALALAVMALLSTMPAVHDEVTRSWQMTMGRLYGGEGERNISTGFKERADVEIDNARGAEIKNYWAELDPIQFLIGRGFGGSWYSEFWGTEWTMIHFGPLHLILKGGIGLALGYLATACAAIIAGWHARKVDELYFAASAFSLYVILGFVKHGPIAFSYETVVFWIMLGVAFRTTGLNPVHR